MGTITDPVIAEQNKQITSFRDAANKMLICLKKFKEHLDLMEADF